MPGNKCLGRANSYLSTLQLHSSSSRLDAAFLRVEKNRVCVCVCLHKRHMGVCACLKELALLHMSLIRRSYVNTSINKICACLTVCLCVCIYVQACLCVRIAACQVCVSLECMKPWGQPGGSPAASVLTQTRARHTKTVPCSQAIKTHTESGSSLTFSKIMHDVTNNYRETTWHWMPTYCNTHLCLTWLLLFKDSWENLWGKMM